MFPASVGRHVNTRFASIPTKLVAYGLSLAQVEQQLTNNNTNAGGSFIQEGLQQINVRAVGLVDKVRDIDHRFSERNLLSAKYSQDWNSITTLQVLQVRLSIHAAAESMGATRTCSR